MKKKMFAAILAAASCMTAGALAQVEDASILVRGYSFGPGVPAVVLQLSEVAGSVTAGEISVSTAGVAREVTGAYLRDEWGEAVEGASDRVALTLSEAELREASPFDSKGFTTHSTWRESYPVTIKGTLTTVAGGDTLDVDADLIGARISPDTALLNRRMEHTGVYENPMTGAQDGITIRMAAYEPEVLAGGDKQPLIVWLHGHSEGGTDVNIALLGNEVTALAKEPIQAHFISEDGVSGAYVLAAHCETCWMDHGDGLNGDGTQSSRYIAALRDAIDAYIETNPDVDASRIYLGGCSNGGYMTVHMLMAYPGTFAAAFPICEAVCHPEGSADGMSMLNDEMFDSLSYEAIWFVQSADDVAVDPNKDVIPTYRDLIFMGAEDYWLSMFASYNHAVWAPVFKDKVTGVQDPMVVSEEMRTEPTNNGGGALDAAGFTNLFDWLNAHVLAE